MSAHEECQDLTLSQAAAWLGLPPRTLERWARNGRIPSTVTATGVRIFSRGELLKRSMTIDDVGREQH